MPAERDSDAPWTCCLQALTRDEAFWSEQVRHPAVSWLASGGRGAPIAPAEAIAGAHFPGVDFNNVIAAGAGDNDRKRQANRDKRAARKRRQQEQREELHKLKAGKRSEHPEPNNKKGSGKGKSKDQAGLQLCFSWASGTGAVRGCSSRR